MANKLSSWVRNKLKSSMRSFAIDSKKADLSDSFFGGSPSSFTQDPGLELSEVSGGMLSRIARSDSVNSGQIKRCNFSENPEKSIRFLSSDIRIGGIRGGEKIGVNVGGTSEGCEEATCWRVVCRRAIIDRLGPVS